MLASFRSAHRRARSLALTAVLVVLVASVPHASARAVGPFRELPTLGGEEAQGFDINDDGVVVGSSTTDAGATHAFAFDPRRDALVDLHPAGAESSVARAVNDAGLVAGHALTSDGRRFAFVHDLATGATTDLGDLGRPGWGPQVEDIDEAGRIVGAFSTGAPGSSDRHAFVYDLGTGAVTDLGDLGNQFAHATAISDAGIVVGYTSTCCSSPFDAWYHDLSTGTTHVIPRVALGFSSLVANDVNVAGTIVGHSARSSSRVAFTFDIATGALTDLGTLPGGTSSYATAINDAGLVVGDGNAAPGSNPHSTLWAYDPTTATMTDLGSLPGTTQMFGPSVNERGELTGLAYWRATGPEPLRRRAFALAFGEPQPAPSLAVSGCDVATLDWRHVDDPTRPPVTSFEVRRDGVAIAEVATSPFVDAAGPASATYEVVARSATGSSPPSPAVAWAAAPCTSSTTTTTTSSTTPDTVAPGGGSGPATAVPAVPRYTG